MRRSLRLSVFEGIFAIQYLTLTGGTMLLGFLLALGATEFQIGLGAMFALLGGLVQPLGAELIRRLGGWRKPVCLAAAVVDNLLWLVSLGAALWLEPAVAVQVVIVVLAFQQMATAFVAVGWTSWMSDLVPASIRGRYFGRRNFICNALGAVTAIAAGRFLQDVAHEALWGFLVLIGAGMLFRLAGWSFLFRQPEPRPSASPEGGFTGRLTQPLRDAGFRRLLVYGSVWAFGVNLASPFFTVYMVRDLGIGFGTVALLAGCTTISLLLGQRFWGPLSDRFGNQQVVRATGLSIALQPLWWLFTSDTGPGFLLIALLNVTGGFAWGGYHIASANLMMRMAPEHGKTGYFAVHAALAGVCGALGTLAGGAFARLLVEGPAAFGVLPGGLKLLFLTSCVLRLAAWGLLHRVEEPVRKPRLNLASLTRDLLRTMPAMRLRGAWRP